MGLIPAAAYKLRIFLRVDDSKTSSFRNVGPSAPLHPEPHERPAERHAFSVRGEPNAEPNAGGHAESHGKSNKPAAARADAQPVEQSDDVSDGEQLEPPDEPRRNARQHADIGPTGAAVQHERR